MAIGTKERKAFKRKVDEIVAKTIMLDKESVKGAMSLLKDMRKDVIASIATVDQFDAAFLPTLKAQINARTREFGRQLKGYVSSQESKSWDIGIEMNDAPITAAEIQIGLPMLSDDLLLVAQAYSADLITGLENEMLDKINTRLNNAVLGKDTPWVAMRKIDNEVFQIKKGAGVTWRTERITRTEVNRVYSISSQARMEQSAEHIPELRKRWITTLSHRVRGIGEKRKIPRISPISGQIIDHRQAHDQIVGVNEPYIVSGEQLMYPRDPSGSAQNVVNCSCVSIPELAE